jgi:ribonuclease HI
MEITIYTDGASRHNPGPSGWGAVFLKDGKIFKELGGREDEATNNQMELSGCVGALKYCEEHFKEAQIHLHTDSAYTMNGINSWIHGWKKNGWKTAAKKSVLNKELWQALDEVHQKLEVTWHKVKGHSGDEGNERADVIATSFADDEDCNLIG